MEHVKQKAWVPIGGRIEPNETPFEAVIREIAEETGFSIGKDYGPMPLRDFELGLNDLVGMLSYDEHEVLPSGLHMCFSYMMHSRHRGIVKCEEYTNVRWLNWPELAAITKKNGPALLDGLELPHNVVRILNKCFRILHGSGW